ncbi:MAG: PaaI family thioesterase [Deltaproteobacteria bacterium]|jgi:uncharacterized protein (TIGR00369 family)|nr:PaaI family thioesterase [Deltaproteobacteria bacterium]MBW2477596.1 PaaI family thioesterase [Deltaproteobacteria bacterium]MBW2505403.1 PaaI family thioesterase [Deltaproteobacteria bacterium]
MKINDNQFCFICGSRNPIGLQTKPCIDADERRAYFHVTVPPEFQGWEGVVHGGIVSALLDEVAAYAAMTIAPHVVTAELKTRYIKPVPVNMSLTVEARVLNHVKRSIMVEATLVQEDRLLTRAEAHMMVVKSALTGA